MIEPGLVSAVLVTRGNVPLVDIIISIRDAGIDDIVVWDNSVREDLGCYGRYAGIAAARHSYIYQQDDDLVAPVAHMLAAYDPIADHDTIVANNEPDEHWQLTGRGCIFHRPLADFFRYIAEYGGGSAFYRIADIVFAYSNPYRRVDLGWEDLPWATDPDRMYLQPRHYEVREQALARVRRLNGYKAGVREPQ